MFTGIIQGLGKIKSLNGDKGWRIEIAVPEGFCVLKLGDSVACSGVCLTVSEKSEAGFFADISPETLRVTTAGTWRVGDFLNLEPALVVGDRLGGHFVSGHVDAVGSLMALRKEGECWHMRCGFPEALARYFAVKGSVTVEGISLTINNVNECSFDLMIVPHTYLNTTIHSLSESAPLNLEIDVLMRYVARLQDMAAL
ncbi:MAG: riboflavin synthase [Holosporales bacterium]